MGWVFLVLAALMIIISLVEGKGKDHPKSIDITKDLFHTSTGFKIGAILIIGIIAYVLYHILNIMVDRIILKMETDAIEFIDLLEEPGK
jgi:hypothetical protein